MAEERRDEDDAIETGTLPDEQQRDDVEHLETDDPTADPDTDPAMAAVEEAGGGVAEGFEGSERLLIENAEGERDDNPLSNPFDSEIEEGDGEAATYGEADQLPPEPEPEGRPGRDRDADAD